jgi:hypothetical protein
MGNLDNKWVISRTSRTTQYERCRLRQMPPQCAAEPLRDGCYRYVKLLKELEFLLLAEAVTIYSERQDLVLNHRNNILPY